MHGNNEKVLERLLRCEGEYGFFCQSIVIEGEFIESDSARCPIRQVILGLTPENLVIACRVVPCVKDMLLQGQRMLGKGAGDHSLLKGLLGKSTGEDRAHVTATILCQQDATLVGDLELSSIVPLPCIKLTFMRHDTMRLTYGETDIKFYELTTTQMNGNLKDTWNLWKRTAPRFIDAKWTSLLVRLRQHDEHEAPSSTSHWIDSFSSQMEPLDERPKDEVKKVTFDHDATTHSKDGLIKNKRFKAAVHQTILKKKTHQQETNKEAKTGIPDKKTIAPNQRRVSMADATILFRAAAKQVIDTNKGKPKKTNVLGAVRKRLFKS